MKNISNKLSSVVLLTACLWGFSNSANAVDGVILITQANALAGNVTPGDTAGFPVWITQPGSYRLAGNLTNGDANKNTIEIKVANVSLDLNGFVISGPAVCQMSVRPPFDTIDCRNTGSGNGIRADLGEGYAASDLTQQGSLSITNGTIQGMGSSGISTNMKGPVTVRNVRVISNGAAGIGTENAILEAVHAFENGGVGIATRYGLITNSNANVNGRSGISAYQTTLIGNVSFNNMAYGVTGSGVVSAANNFFQSNLLGQISGSPLTFINIGNNTCGAALCP